MQTDLQDFYYNQDHGYFSKVFGYLTPKELAGASRVCKDWHLAADLKIQELRKKKLEELETLVSNKIVSYKSLSEREFHYIARYIELNPLLITAKLINRFAESCKQAQYALKIFSLAKEIPLQAFNYAITENSPEPVLRALLRGLSEQVEECVISAMERNKVSVLQLLLKDYYSSSEEHLFHLAMKYPKKEILDELVKRYPNIETRTEYQKWLLDQAIKNSDKLAIDQLLTAHPELTPSCEDITRLANGSNSSPDAPAIKQLLDFSLKKGDKVTISQLNRLVSNGLWLHHKDLKYKLFSKAFVVSNQFDSVESLYADFEIEKFIRGPSPLVKFIVSYASGDLCLLESDSHEKWIIKCANKKIVQAPSTLLKKCSWFQIAENFNISNDGFDDKVRLKMFTRETITNLVSYLKYSGELDFLTEYAICDLFRLADFLDFQDLVAACRMAFIKRIEMTSINHYLRYSDYPEELKPIALKMAYEEIERRFLKSGSLNEIDLSPLKKLLVEFIKYDIIDIKGVFELFFMEAGYRKDFATKPNRRLYLKIATHCLTSLPCDYTSLLTFLKKPNNLKIEFFIMEVLLADIRNREYKERRIPKEIVNLIDTSFAYKTLIAASLVEKDPTMLEWLLEAAKENYYPALLQLSICYREGLGVEKDIDLANKFDMKALKISGML